MRMLEFEEPPAEITRSLHPAHTPPTARHRSGATGARSRAAGRGGDGCNFDLHVACALAAPTMKHPLFRQDNLELELLAEAPPPVDKTFCDGCGFRTPGLVYHCFAKNLDLHPTCAALKAETAFQGGHLVAQLCWEPGGGHHRCCVVCAGGGEKFWAYRWGYGGRHAYLRVACMKKIAFQSWKQAYQVSIGGGLVEASVPAMTAVLQQNKRTGENNTGRVEIVEAGISILLDML